MSAAKTTKRHARFKRSGSSRAGNPLAKLAIRRASRHGGYGWVRDLPDARDFVYAAPLIRFPKGLPASIDLRTQCPPIYNQGQLGSCTGNAAFPWPRRYDPMRACDRLRPAGTIGLCSSLNCCWLPIAAVSSRWPWISMMGRGPADGIASAGFRPIPAQSFH